MDEFIAKIEEEGYCRIPAVYSQPQMSRALELVQFWHEKSRSSISDDVPFQMSYASCL